MIPRTRSSAAMRDARSPDTGSTLIAPSGQSSSASSSASASADSGVRLAGLTSTGLPAASAGATLCATRFSGKLNGVIASTGPIGKRRSRPPRLPDPRLGVERDPASLHPLGLLAGPAEDVLRARGLPHGLADRLARLERDRARERLDALADPRGRRQQALGALPCRHRRKFPGLRRPRRRERRAPRRPRAPRPRRRPSRRRGCAPRADAPPSRPRPWRPRGSTLRATRLARPWARCPA